MHTVVDPQDTVQRYHTELMQQTVHALCILMCPPCQMGLPRFLLIEKILCFYCALRFLKSCGILLFPDYAGSTDGRKVCDIAKGSWVITFSISPKAGSRQVLPVKSP
jgi:hypothetical protein